jgi:hypothetical protein
MGVRSIRRDRRSHTTSQLIKETRDADIPGAAHRLLQARRYERRLTSPEIVLAMPAS